MLKQAHDGRLALAWNADDSHYVLRGAVFLCYHKKISMLIELLEFALGFAGYTLRVMLFRLTGLLKYGIAYLLLQSFKVVMGFQADGC